MRAVINDTHIVAEINDTHFVARIINRPIVSKLDSTTRVVLVHQKREVVTVGSNAQTVFEMATAPGSPSTSELVVNGVQYSYGVDYMIDATTITWTGVFDLSTTDRMEVFYT